ncbi:MAG TPA: metallophosphoesterase [Myxococcota bacterium]|nr:metallophosphoesterase [Myxococcota bacterium]
MSLSQRLYFVRGVMRAVRRGDMFPASGRRAAQAAPGGSTQAAAPPPGNEVNALGISRHRFPMAGLKEEISILHLSDVHLHEADKDLETLVALIGTLSPDLLVLTGDILMRGWKDAAVDLFLKSLPKARLGSYAVMGNWEYWAGAPERFWEATLARYGIKLLYNQSVDPGPLQIVGTDDWLAGIPDVERSFRAIDPSRPVLVLTHSPKLFPQLVRPGVRLVLAGHTHGGQVRLPGLGPLFLPKGSGDYPWAWYEQEGVWLFVSRGIGWSVAPVRWRAPPELAWITLLPDPSGL